MRVATGKCTVRRMNARTAILTALATLCAAGLAPQAAADSTAAAQFVSLDQVDKHSSARADMAVINGNGDPGWGRYRLELDGRYVFGERIGGFAHVALAGLVDNDSDNEVALSNFEIGGLYIVPLTEHDLVVRGSFALPTASDDLPKLVAGLGSSIASPSNVVLAYGGASVVRASGSLISAGDGKFYRLDLGVDVPFGSDVLDERPLFRASAGIGTRSGAVSVTAELVNLLSTGEGVNGFGNNNGVHIVTLTARYDGDSVSPFFAFGLPLDSSVQDSVSLMVKLGVDVHIDQM